MWVEYKEGDELPPSDTWIDVKFRDDDIWFSVFADNLWFDHNGHGDDIVAWKISEDREGWIRAKSV